MIIVEGPDNSGKSTLVEKLQKTYRLKNLILPHRGPTDNYQDLYNNMNYIINKAMNPRDRWVVDRLPLISESIYGPLCRKRDLWVENFVDKVNFTKALFTLRPFIIYCRPPLQNILNMKTHQVKDYDTEIHLHQLNSQKLNIVNAYDNFFYHWYDSYHFFRYDYTNETHDFQLNKLLKEYTKW